MSLISVSIGVLPTNLTKNNCSITWELTVLRDGSRSKSLPNLVGWFGYWLRTYSSSAHCDFSWILSIWFMSFSPQASAKTKKRCYLSHRIMSSCEAYLFVYCSNSGITIPWYHHLTVKGGGGSCAFCLQSENYFNTKQMSQIISHSWTLIFLLTLPKFIVEICSVSLSIVYIKCRRQKKTLLPPHLPPPHFYSDAYNLRVYFQHKLV